MSDESERIYAKATEYLVHSQIETPEERSEREKWLAEDPRHLRAYEYMIRIRDGATKALEAQDMRALAAQDCEEIRRTRKE